MVEFHFEEATQTLFCRFDGRMDTVICGIVAEKFNAELSGLKGKTDRLRIVFDLARVDYVASSFLRLSLVALKGVTERKFCHHKCRSAGAKNIQNCRTVFTAERVVSNDDFINL